MNKYLTICLLIISTLLLSPAAQAEAELVDKIIAIVNHEIITLSELNKLTTEKQRSAKKAGISEKELRQQILQELIDQLVLQQAIKNAKTEVSDKELQNSLQEILKRNRISLDILKREIAREGKSYSEYKEKMRAEIKQAKFINQVIAPRVKITDQDLKDYYQKNQAEFRGKQEASIALIELSFANITKQEEFDALSKQALSLAKRAQRGDKHFSQLAKKHSTGPAAKQGGKLGMVNLKTLPEDVARTVRNLKVDQVSRPIPTDKAFVIVKLIALPELSADDFDRLRDDIYAVLYEQKLQETMEIYLQKQRQKTFIDIRY